MRRGEEHGLVFARFPDDPRELPTLPSLALDRMPLEDLPRQLLAGDHSYPAVNLNYAIMSKHQSAARTRFLSMIDIIITMADRI